MNRREFMMAGAAVAAGGMFKSAYAEEPVAPAAGKKDARSAFPVYDLHVHRSDKQDVPLIMERAKNGGLEAVGIMENVASFAITDNTKLAQFLADTEPYPVWRGLQPMELGWSRNLSKDLIARCDYVLLDPQTIRNGNRYGDTLELWEHECYIPDEEEFMEVNMEHYHKILTCDERLDIFSWPLYLPPCIARDYYRLWTRPRMEKVIGWAKARGVALEITDLARTPHAEFILMAKNAGLKFTFGSDTRNERTARLDYCKRIARLCGLERKDFFIPARRIG